MSCMPIRTLVIGVLLLVPLMLAGCGGGPGPEPEPYDSFTVLQRFGLTTRVKTDKTEYQKGEQVHMWLEVENTGSQARQLDAYPGPYSSSDPTYYCSLYIPGSEGGWHLEGNEHISLVVQPGQIARVVEQTANTDLAFQTGDYRVSIQLNRVRVDGGAFDGHADLMVNGTATVQIASDGVGG